MKINWVRKLTSRKFWMAIASFVAMLMVAFGATQNSAAQVSGIIMAGAAVVAYIIGEGLADAKSQVSGAGSQPESDISTDMMDELTDNESGEDDGV